MTPTHLYRYFDDKGALLYIGISSSAVRRLLEHASGKVWASLVSKVDVQTLPSREAAAAAEAAAIKAEKPKFNVHHNRKTPHAGHSKTSRTVMLAVRVPHELLSDLGLLYGPGKPAKTRTEAVILALTCGISSLAPDV